MRDLKFSTRVVFGFEKHVTESSAVQLPAPRFLIHFELVSLFSDRKTFLIVFIIGVIYFILSSFSCLRGENRRLFEMFLGRDSSAVNLSLKIPRLLIPLCGRDSPSIELSMKTRLSSLT